MNVLLVGARGMLGRAVSEVLARRGDRVDAPSHAELDLADIEAIPRSFAARPRPDVVINCAAYTEVDRAEQEEPLATLVNGTGVGALATVAGRAGALFVHFGTDYVFDGVATVPYPVDAPLAPTNAYGRSKAEGERALAASGAPFVYARTSWLYAPWGKNFVRTIAKAASERDSLRVVDDQRGRPTSAEHLARTTLALVDRGARGTFHVTDGGECTWFELAREIARRVAPSCRVDPCTTSEFPRPAKRPAYSVLDLSATEALVGAMGDWRTHVADVLARRE